MTPRKRHRVSEKAPNLREQAGHLPAPMVPGHIGVELQPQAFDAVLVGAVGWQEVETDAGAPAGQSGPHDPAVMDDVVVEDQVKDSGTTIATQQCAQQVQEQPASLLVPLDPDQVTRPVVQGTGQVAFFVAPE